MRDYEPEFRNRGVSIAAVGLGDRYYGNAFKEEFELSFPLLIDEEREAYRAADLKVGSLLSILNSQNLKEGRRARAAGHQQGRLGKNPFQLGGTFVFGPGNVDTFVHVNATYSDFAPIDRVIDALD